ncbi:MAG: hypothetical protein ACYTEX_28400 [Planctomycetota bacterium]|jgi:hypothetical protein
MKKRTILCPHCGESFTEIQCRARWKRTIACVRCGEWFTEIQRPRWIGYVAFGALVIIVLIVCAMACGAEPTIKAPSRLKIGERGAIITSGTSQVLCHPSAIIHPLVIPGAEGGSMFMAEQAGRYTLLAVFIEDNHVVGQAGCVIVVGEGPDPEPKPDPDPKPDPKPDPTPGPVEDLFVLVVEEKQSRRPHVPVLHSLLVEKWLKDNGHRIERRDQHDVDDARAVRNCGRGCRKTRKAR